MGSKPQPFAEAVLSNVAGKTVPNAENALSSFSDITWQDTGKNKLDPPPEDYSVITGKTNGLQPEEPADKVGKSIPIDTAITITIAPSPKPK